MNDPILRGDVVAVDLEGASGCEMMSFKPRPCIVVSSDVMNDRSPLVVIVPMTSQVKPRWYVHQVPLHCSELGHNGYNSMVNVDHIRSIDKSRIHKVLYHVSAATMAKVDACIKNCLGLLDASHNARAPAPSGEGIQKRHITRTTSSSVNMSGRTSKPSRT